MPELNGVSIDDLKSLALTGYGHFTSMRVDGSRVRGLSLHLARLARDCQTVFGTELDTEYVRYRVREATSSITGSFIARVTVFDPALEMGRPGNAANPKIMVTHRAAPALPMAPLRLRSARYSRDLPQVKHVGLMAALSHRRAAQIAGYDDAVFVDSDGYVTEGVTWNVGFVDGGEVIWPQGELLPGVTTALLSQACGPGVVARVNLAEIHGMDAAFATNTSFGVRPISAIDGHQLAEDHPVIRMLQIEYEKIEGEAL